MLATDPLSLVFIGCIVFAGAFLVLSTMLGLGHGHALHFGHAGHAVHIGHAAHAGHSVHVTHGTHVAGSHAPSHSITPGQPTTAGASASLPWQSFSAALLGTLNLYGLLMFLLVFGLLGYILHNAARTGALLAILLPIAVAACAAAGTSAMLRHFFESDDAGELTDANSQIEGQLGTVTMAIRTGGVGEVMFTSANRGRQSVSARSSDDQAIPAGAQIVILGYDQGIARVQTWDRFLAGARASQTPAAPPGDARD
jgi:hypothetical protein